MAYENIYNISAMVQPDSIFNGWIFECFYCCLKTHNCIVCDNIYELYLCKHCIKNNPELSDIATKYCRKIAKDKIHIV